MKLIIASNNAHKLTEIKAILGDRFDEILSLREAGIEHETVEDGATFLENAAKKAREIAQLSGCCALADDSGLCVDALGGAPGIYSARYSGVHGDDKANNRKLLADLEAVPDEERGAHFTCAIVLARPDGTEVSAEGYFYGVIAHGETGFNGFGYDPLFYLPEYGCTSAELSPEEKNRISHRSQALRKLVEKLEAEPCGEPEDFRLLTLREAPELMAPAAAWFHAKWGVPEEAYRACMEEYLRGDTEYGWYLCLDGDRIVGGLGVIRNDFHDRADLFPNICAVYTEADHRCRGIAGRLLNMAVEDLRAKGVSPVYLNTDHIGFYERYGWEFFCMVQGDGEPHKSRLYIHR